MFLTCCRSITISYLESWRCCQCKKKVQLIQPGREEETSNFKIHRTWTGYLVRDVQIKNKSPVSWSCFPPGPWLTDCPMPIRCTGTSSPSFISHMKEIDSTGGSANYLINYVDIISIKDINNFLEDQVPLYWSTWQMLVAYTCRWLPLSTAQALVICSFPSLTP